MDNLLTRDRIIEFCMALAVQIAEFLPGHPDSIQIERFDESIPATEIRMAWGDQVVLIALDDWKITRCVNDPQSWPDLVQWILLRFKSLTKNFPHPLSMEPGYHVSDTEAKPEWSISN